MGQVMVGGGDWHYTVKYRKEQPSLKSEVHLLDDSAILCALFRKIPCD